MSAKTSRLDRPKTGNFAAKSLRIFEPSGSGRVKVDSIAVFDATQRFRHLST